MKKMYILLTTLTSLVGTVASYGQCSVFVNSHTDVSCHGDSDGSAQLTTIGVPNFTYSWAPGGQTVQNPNNLAPGTHTVTMTDGNSCQSTATVTIGEPAVLTSSSSQNDVTCHGACNGNATINPSGGTPFYSYQWDSTANNQTGATASNLCPGVYHVTITDANGCMAHDTVSITEPSMLNINTTATPPSCNVCTDGAATASVSGGTPSYTYSWSPGGQTTPTASNLANGSYTVTATDAQGCEISDTIMVGSVTGLFEPNDGFSLTTYPNPVVRQFYVEMTNVPGTAHISAVLYDATGRVLQRQEYTVTRGSVNTFSLEGEPAGLYFLQLEVNGKATTQKIVKR